MPSMPKLVADADARNPVVGLLELELRAGVVEGEPQWQGDHEPDEGDDVRRPLDLGYPACS